MNSGQRTNRYTLVLQRDSYGSRQTVLEPISYKNADSDCSYLTVWYATALPCGVMERPAMSYGVQQHVPQLVSQHVRRSFVRFPGHFPWVHVIVGLLFRKPGDRLIFPSTGDSLEYSARYQRHVPGNHGCIGRLSPDMFESSYVAAGGRAPTVLRTYALDTCSIPSQKYVHHECQTLLWREKGTTHHPCLTIG